MKIKQFRTLLAASIWAASFCIVPSAAAIAEETESTTDEITTVGKFATEDVFGNSYTQELFEDYDLTLVNAFTTWCSPCVNEMPELEKLRQYYEEKDIKFGIVAVVLDARTADGINDTAVQQAMLLSARSGAQFPFLIPDEEYLNGRLDEIESVPESFFVDSEGNIVSGPYVGANTKERWVAVVNQELEALAENNE